jgi:hypothetical protein
VPTADQRALVENAAAFGLTQADSAEQLKIDENTLRKHFRDELRPSGHASLVFWSAGTRQGVRDRICALGNEIETRAKVEPPDKHKPSR